MKRLFENRGRPLLIGVCLLGLLASVSGPFGQDKSKYYTVMHPGDFSIDWTGFYEKIDGLTAQTRRDFPHKLDLTYGEDPKQKLDLYFPQGKVEKAPVFLFFHGGGFREGDRAHYGFVARPFAENGVISAIASYRLTADDFHYPAQPQDAEKALAWLYRNIERMGGDPNRISIGGHSAGALMAADVAVRQDWLKKAGLPADLIKVALPVSGHYDLRQDKIGETAYVTRAEQLEAASPSLNIRSLPPFVLVAVGSVEESYAKSSQDFVERLQKEGGSVRLLVLEGMAHDETALALGDKDSELFGASLQAIQSH